MRIKRSLYGLFNAFPFSLDILKYVGIISVHLSVIKEIIMRNSVKSRHIYKIENAGVIIEHNSAVLRASYRQVKLKTGESRLYRLVTEILQSLKGLLYTAKTAHKVADVEKQIDGLVFVTPRMIEIKFDGEIGNCQRPLRGQTAQGERIALANSETIPAGATAEFTVHCMCDDDVELVKEWLEYGRWHGLGQWRNSGKGAFTYEIIE